MENFKKITSAAEMIATIRTIGIIPFTRCSVPGWSIQELTDPDYWFTTSDQLGPWDWKIEALHEGILYGKFISRSSCFATETMYRHLMNWRRSRLYYQMAEGGEYRVTTVDQRLHKHLAPILLNEIRRRESLESSELRKVLEEVVPVATRKKVGGYIEKHLIPKIDRQAIDFLMAFLDMGTWTLVGDVSRVYRGPNHEYKGWQRNIVTTPEALLDDSVLPPFLADSTPRHDTHVDCTPEESRDFLVQSILQYFPDAPSALNKLIDGK